MEHRQYGDHQSEAAESEAPLQIPTPHFGESYSQSGYSPVLQRSQDRVEPSESVKRAKGSSASIARASGEHQKTNEELDDDTEFVENDAYVTFAVPKFRIVSEEKGSVFETVKMK
jgi:hypothetical protein